MVSLSPLRMLLPASLCHHGGVADGTTQGTQHLQENACLSITDLLYSAHTDSSITNFSNIPQENADALAHEVSLAVFHLAGGKGAPPQPI